MPSVTARRVPRQRRSIERVEQILDAASRQVAAAGVEALTTRSIADAAGVPISSLYQYFKDRDAVLLAMVERDTTEMDEEVAARLADLSELSIRSIVETTMRSYVTVFHRRPAFVEIWLRGRTNVAIRDFGREHNRRTATSLLALAADAGLVAPRVKPVVAELAVEIGDRCFQLAFERKLKGETFIIEEGISMVASYLETYATEAGRRGIAR
jgi:AcrR family transcriptional regulator